MFNVIKTAAIASALAIGALAAAPAQADSLHLKLKDGDVGFGLTIGDGYGPGYGYAGYGGGYGGGYGPKCQPWKAVHKAKAMGFKKPHVVDVDWNRIVVKGKKYGDSVKVVFGKAPHCPVKAVY